MTPISDLPSELLCDIANRLHTAVDVICFRAICRAWRDTRHHLPPQRALLPWLFTPSLAAGTSAAAGPFRCVFSKASYHAAPGLCIRDKRAAPVDGTAHSWFIDALFVNPSIGSASTDNSDDRRFWDWIDRFGYSHCIFSRDGTFLVYRLSEDTYLEGSISRESFGPYGMVGNWVPERLGPVDTDSCYAVACHDGATVCVDSANCHIHKKEPLGHYHNKYKPLPDEPGKVRRRSYLLELRGELLLARVLQDAGCTGDNRLSVSVHAFVCNASLHALDPDAAVDDAEPLASLVWEKREGVLGDHVLFLGYPGSFAMEAVQFGGDVPGGCAYFIVKSEPCCVYKYNFEDVGTAATLVDTLPTGWNDERCTWFLPKLDIDQNQKEEDAPASRRCHDLWIYVGDLSQKVDSSRLRKIFSKHGKVVQARVAYDKRGRSRGFGFVTMATQDGFDKAIAALNAMKKPKSDPSRTEIVCTLCLLILLVVFALLYYRRLIL